MSKLVRGSPRRRSATTLSAISAAASAIGGLISSTQRQLRASVMIPPNSTPAAPPSPFIAAHRPIARWSWGPGGNDEVMIASEDAAINAQLQPGRDRGLDGRRTAAGGLGTRDYRARRRGAVSALSVC